MSRKGLNIYKRKDGRWEARYIKSRNALGKPKYGYLYASSYREVRCDLQHTLQLQGKPSGSEERTRNSTFELVSMEWLDAFSINFKESTYIRYRTLIECYLMPSFQTVKIEKITKEMVRKLCKHLELHGKKDKTGLSPKTISDVLSVLRRILNYAGTLGIFVDSKVLDIRVKQTQKSLPILSLPEQMILQQYLEEHPDALNLGIRGKRSRFRKGISISVRRCNVSRIGYLGAKKHISRLRLPKAAPLIGISQSQICCSVFWSAIP